MTENTAPQILVKGLSSSYDVEHLARVFYPGAPLRSGAKTGGHLLYARAGAHRLVAGLRHADGRCALRVAPPPAQREEKAQKQALCRLVYDLLREQTGTRPPWGMLTGVRPVNLLRKHLRASGEDAAHCFLAGDCDVDEEKYALARGIVKTQGGILAQNGEGHYSLYVSIPFCPSRCSYCSFVSRTIQQEGHLVEPYLEKLKEELAQTARVAKECGLALSTVYIGGGTPTALDSRQLEGLLQAVEAHFGAAACREYTVEAGRPDCTDYEKLRLLKEHGVTRISINPQSLSDTVLQNIGRRHTAADVLRCFEDARRAGHASINMDLIAGLPGDTVESFADTLNVVARLAPENITLHTLTLKRASDMVIERQTGASSPSRMIDSAYRSLPQSGYHPYYLYRQKSGVENLENTGWTVPGQEGIYNVFIMEEAHTILAVGAGASTKAVLNGGKTIRRLYNHKLPLEYIENFDEIIKRKKEVSAIYAGNLDTQTTG